MVTISRELFPSLPPELRHEIYTYLSGPETTTLANVTGLPLKLKTLECKHTIVQICPSHHGSAGLLALETFGFQEASEYNSWLLNNALELNIAVTFRGRANTFVQSDWDSKMRTHLRRLAKQHPWLTKVARYNIQMLWKPADDVLKSKKNKRTAGQIMRNIATALTTLVHDDVKKRRGELSIRLHLDHTAAAQTVLSATRFGFADFFLLADVSGFREETREVWKHAHTKPVEQKRASGLVPLPTQDTEALVGVEIERGFMAWKGHETSHLLMKRQQLEGKVVGIACGDKKEGGGHVLLTLLGECLG